MNYNVVSIRIINSYNLDNLLLLMMQLRIFGLWAHIAGSRGASHLPTPSSQVQGHQVPLLRAALTLLRIISVQPLPILGVVLSWCRTLHLVLLKFRRLAQACLSGGPRCLRMSSLSSSVWSAQHSLLVSANLLREIFIPLTILLTNQYQNQPLGNFTCHCSPHSDIPKLARNNKIMLHLSNSWIVIELSK